MRSVLPRILLPSPGSGRACPGPRSGGRGGRSSPVPAAHCRAARPPASPSSGTLIRAYPAPAPAPAGARFAAARIARLIARARRRARRFGPVLANVSRNVMFPMSSVELRRSVPAYRFSVALHSVRAAGGPAPPGGGTLFARVTCVRACAGGRARLAPAWFAHLIARARRRTHVYPSFPPGLFSGPSHCFPAQKSRKAAPGAASLCGYCSAFSNKSSPRAA